MKIGQLLILSLSLLSLKAFAGQDRGGAGFPQLSPDVKFAYDCKLYLTERSSEKTLSFSIPFIYNEETGNNTGVLNIVTESNDWVASEAGTSPTCPQGQHLLIRPGFIQLELFGESSTMASTLVTNASNKVMSDKKYLASTSLNKIVNGEKQSTELTVSCLKIK